MSDKEPESRCTVTGSNGQVLIQMRDGEAFRLSPVRAVEFSNQLLAAATLANGQPAWRR